MKTVLISRGAGKADILFAGSFRGEKNFKLIRKTEPAFARLLEAAVKKEKFLGKARETFASFQPSYRQAAEAVALGLGEKKDFKVTCLRKAVGEIVGIASGKKANKIRVILDSFLTDTLEAKDVAAVFAEGAILSSYRFLRYKTKKKDDLPKFPETLELVCENKALVAGLRAVVARAEKIAKAVILARDLNNEPGNVMNPPRIVEESRKLAKEKGLKCTALGLAELKKLGMNGILAVNRGSVTPPALIILEHGENQRERNGLPHRERRYL